MRKSYNYEVVKKKNQIVLRNGLDPDSDFWQDPDPDSMNMDPKHMNQVAENFSGT